MSATEYLHSLRSILTRIELEQTEPIRQAAAMVAASFARGGVLHTFGSGHSHMIAEEAFFRAGGLAPVNAILDERLVFLHGALESTDAERRSGYARALLEREQVEAADTAIIISNSGRNAVPIEMAQEMHLRGVPVIAITNLQQSKHCSSRHASGIRLFELADVVIDNCVPEGDAVLPLEGTPHRIGPSSTIAGAAIMNSIIVEAAICLQRMGVPVPVLLSANVEASSREDLETRLALGTSRVRLFQRSLRS